MAGRTAYPIYVNESPQYFHSKDNQTVIVYYSASGCWSPYYCTGMLTADADSDLLNPASWKKSPCSCISAEAGRWSIRTRLVFRLYLRPMEQNGMCYIRRGASRVGIQGESETRNPRLQKIGWDANGMPDLGIPLPVNTPLPKPSGTVTNQ